MLNKFHHPRRIRYSERYHDRLMAHEYHRAITAPIPKEVWEEIARRIADGTAPIRKLPPR
jgi:hypothetical protein